MNTKGLRFAPLSGFFPRVIFSLLALGSLLQMTAIQCFYGANEYPKSGQMIYGSQSGDFHLSI